LAGSEAPPPGISADGTKAQGAAGTWGAGYYRGKKNLGMEGGRGAGGGQGGAPGGPGGGAPRASQWSKAVFDLPGIGFLEGNRENKITKKLKKKKFYNK